MVDDDEDDSDEPMPHECCLHSERTLWDLRKRAINPGSDSVLAKMTSGLP